MKPVLRTIAIFAMALLSGPCLAQKEPFQFVALGDMPYNIPDDYGKFDRLIDRINVLKPAFSIHVGDIVSGLTKCSEENFTKVKTRFDRFAGALIYTPGDNDWTDCHRLLMGRYDPLERLAYLRKLFFPEIGKSLGGMPLALENQSLVMPEAFSNYIENTRFLYKNVWFASAHVVGSLNNHDPDRPAMVAEYEARDKANIAWIDDAFRLAGQSSALGLVLFWQANVHATPRRTPDAPFTPPFHNTINAVERGAAKFKRPVLVIYGDFHFFEVQPFVNLKREPIPGVTRLQVFGEKHVHAVRVRVEPSNPALFAIEPLIVPENGLP